MRNLLAAIGNQLITCADKELVTLQPPAGQSCGTFLAQYISSRGGYLTNPDATAGCRFCSSRTTDEWMGPAFNIFYRHHWRDFGFFCAYIVFNVSDERLMCGVGVLMGALDLRGVSPYLFLQSEEASAARICVEEGAGAV